MSYSKWKKPFSKEELVRRFGDIQDKKYICAMDLELTCWDTQETRFSDKQEIIEIGVVILDANRLIIEDKISRTVKPWYHPELSDYCIDLTGITQDEVNNSKSIFTELRVLHDMGLPDAKDFVWACWGRDPIWLQNELIS